MPAPPGDERATLDSLTTAVLLLTADGLIQHMNAAAETLLGASARQSLGRDVTALVPELGNLAARAVRDQQSYGQMLGYAAAGQEGAGIYLACRVTPAGGASAAVVAELVDATHWRQVDREYALISQHEASRRMIRQLAHEIRNPLGGLRGAAQLLERELPDPDLREFTRIIIGEADRLAALADSLLGPVQAPRRQDVNIHEILERVLALVDAESAGRIRLQRDYDPSLPTLAADSDQLIQALLNIARNALQAALPGGQIICRTRALTGYVLGATRHPLVMSIEVEDDGPGVPPELADSIFYPLVTGRPEGTGLGLALAQDLVSRHGGLIEYQSRPGRTLFMVRLPIGDAECAV